jgi:hypothetical protein
LFPKYQVLLLTFQKYGFTLTTSYEYHNWSSEMMINPDEFSAQCVARHADLRELAQRDTMLNAAKDDSGLWQALWLRIHVVIDIGNRRFELGHPLPARRGPVLAG